MTPRPWLRGDEVIDAVVEWTGISRSDLIGVGQSKRERAARNLLYGTLSHAGWSTGEIGRMLQRHHTTVLSSLERLSIESYEEVEAILEQLRAALTPGPASSSSG